MAAWCDGLPRSDNYTIMNIAIEIKGADEVSKKLKEQGKSVADSVQTIITKVALNVERFGKFYSPVDTGLMRSTIYPTNITGREAWVGPKTNYAKYVHARVPFMTAARQDTLPTVDAIIKDTIQKALK